VLAAHSPFPTAERDVPAAEIEGRSSDVATVTNPPVYRISLVPDFAAARKMTGWRPLHIEDLEAFGLLFRRARRII
jgi:hypothetical protein